MEKNKDFELKYSHIDHIARERLGLKTNEYLICDTVYQLSNNPKSRKPGWCTASKEYLGRHISLSVRGVRKIVARMVKKKLLERDGNHLRTTERWYKAVIVRKESRNKVPSKWEQSSYLVGTKFLLGEKGNNGENKDLEDTSRNKVPTIIYDSIYNKRSYTGEKNSANLKTGKKELKKHSNKAEKLEKIVEEVLNKQ